MSLQVGISIGSGNGLSRIRSRSLMLRRFLCIHMFGRILDGQPAGFPSVPYGKSRKGDFARPDCPQDRVYRAHRICAKLGRLSPWTPESGLGRN